MENQSLKSKLKNKELLKPFIYFYSCYKNKLHLKKEFERLNNEYKVSIIMPTYNRKNIISDSIDSVLNQSFPNYELIIIDDGSDDGTEEFINDNYFQYIQDEKIKYYKLNHNGVSASRNYGLEKSTGNIISYLDSDNQWKHDFLEVMIKALDKKKNFNCAYCGVKINHNVQKRKEILNLKFNRKRLLKKNFIDLNSFVHKKELYDEYGGFDEDLTHLVDWDLIIRYTKDNKPLHIKKVLVNYTIDHSLGNITITAPLTINWNKIHEKNWLELYKKELKIIGDYFDEDYYVD